MGTQFENQEIQDAISFLSSLGYMVIPPQSIFSEFVVEPTFEDWWNLYDKKRGRKKTEEKWNRLKPQQRIACMNATKAYVDSTPDKQYRADPLTYLNGERWNDEIIINNGNGTDRRNNQTTEQRAADAAEVVAELLAADDSKARNNE